MRRADRAFNRMAMRTACLLPLLFVAGCAADHTVYPSLAPRAVEKRGWAEPAGTAAAPATPEADPALDARIDEQRTALAEAARRFAEADRHAAPLVAAARGAAAGSERWLTAETALTDLDSARAATVDAESALGQIAIDRGAAPDYPPLTAASDAATAQLQAETTRIAALQADLSPS